MRRTLLTIAVIAGLLLTACGAGTAERPTIGVMPTPLGGVQPPPPGVFEGPAARNGCDEAPLPLDITGSIVIAFGGAEGERYRPRCLTVPVGARVVFAGDFATHPLAGGVVSAGHVYRDPASELPYTNAGSEAAFVPVHRGVYAFYCQIHWVLGMRGAIIAE